MYEDMEGYANLFYRILGQTEISDAEGKFLDFKEGFEQAIAVIQTQTRLGKKVIFIGNGGSAAIASHMAIDFWKNGGMRAIAFNDGALLTCIGNDFGYPEVFAKPVQMFADPGDVLVAISSSGRSENILRGVEAARAAGCRVISFSGFSKTNPLRQLGDLNFYIPADRYGFVEVGHQMILHAILDLIIERKAAGSSIHREPRFTGLSLSLEPTLSS